MNTTDEPQAPSAASQLPTGESQIGVVRRPTAPQADDGPVLEHSVAVPEAPPEETVASQPAPSEPAPSEPAPSEPAPSAPSAPAPAPAPAPQAPAAIPLRASLALQESPKVSIPERMNHLSTENQRLRDELQALEEALNRKPE